MDSRPNSEARSPAEDCWNTIRGIRMNESLQADISSEERMPGSEETIPGPTSAPAFPRPPPSPRPQARTRPPKSARSRPQTHSPSYPDRDFPPPVPLLGPQAPEPPKGRTRVEWSYFPEPPELRPAPPYHLWHPTTVMFEYLHVRGYLNSGGFENEEDYYPMLSEHVVQLCRWFSNARQQDIKKEKLIWNDHLHRVDWLKWYWDERERNRARKFVERDELMMEIVQDKILRARELKKEAEREEELMIIAGLDESDKDEDEEEKRELDDIMDLDLGSEGSEEGEIKEKDIHVGNGNQREQTNANKTSCEASQWQGRPVDGRGGENGIRMVNGNQNGDHNGAQNGHQNVNQNGPQNGRPRLKRKASDKDSRWGTVPVNPEGEEDPDGLTQKDWELTMNIGDSLEIKEGASMEEVVRETVLWALDVHETGQMWKRQQADENKDDVPTHRRIRDVMQI